MENERKNILKRIEALREELYKTLHEGKLNQSDVLKISQSLDEMINLLMKNNE